MDQVGGIPGIIAQLVQYDLVGWKVHNVWKGAYEMLYGKQEGRLGYLIAVHAVFFMADRRESQYETLIGECFGYSVPNMVYVIYGEQFPSEFTGRVLVAVGDYDVLFEMAVSPCCAERDENPPGSFKSL